MDKTNVTPGWRVRLESTIFTWVLEMEAGDNIASLRFTMSASLG